MARGNFMPMMVVDDNDFDLELARLNSSNEKIVNIEHGRGLGKKNITDKMRSDIAISAIAGIDPDDIAKEFDISKSSISAYKVGATSTSTYNKPSEALVKNNNATKLMISEKAEEKILSALGLLDSDKIAACRARDIAGIAKDMSAIVKNMSPDVGVINNQQVIVFKPRMKEEDDYDIIDIT